MGVVSGVLGAIAMILVSVMAASRAYVVAVAWVMVVLLEFVALLNVALCVLGHAHGREAPGRR